MPKGACKRYQVVTIPVVHLERRLISPDSTVELTKEFFAPAVLKDLSSNNVYNDPLDLGHVLPGPQCI